jgi:hypothetical protein
VKLHERGSVRDLNYRGNLGFLDRACAQGDTRHPEIRDSRVYLVHGRTKVIGKMARIDSVTSSAVFDEIARIGPVAAAR